MYNVENIHGLIYVKYTKKYVAIYMQYTYCIWANICNITSKDT